MDLISRLFAELRGGDQRLAQTAIAQIAALGEHVFPELNFMLSSSREDERWWAVRVLAEMDDLQAKETLLQALDDGAVSVRQCALLGLREQPHPDAIQKLILFLDDGDTLTRRLAGDALIALGSRAVPDLVEIVGRGTSRARVEAARALARIADQRAIPALYQLLDDESALLSYWAEEGLERMGAGMIFFSSGSEG